MLFRIFCLHVLLILSYSLQAKTLLVLGDSLSAAYGVPIKDGWVSLLEQRILGQDPDNKVVNASISGETTIGALMRLDKILEESKPDLVIIELGGNDGLRGFPLEEIKGNLTQIVLRIKETEANVILVPMHLPPNYGPVYNEKFSSLYEDIAKTENVAVTKFILQDIATDSELMQEDGIHPVTAAQIKMLDNLWPTIEGEISN